MKQKNNLEDCVFCAIATGAKHAHLVHETPNLVAFLDVRPIRPGHVQIVPREHVSYFDELSPELAAEIVQLGQRIALAQKALYGVKRVGFAFTGGDVPHTHAHVVPLVAPTDITSRRYIVEETLTFADLPCATESELAETAEALVRGLNGTAEASAIRGRPQSS